MKLLIDGNILLDVLQKREPHFASSALIWKLCETEQAEGFVSALTFANLVYVMRRELTAEMIADVLKKLSLIFRFTDLTAADLDHAASLQWRDFEDAVQAVTAQRLHADAIITRNVRDFKESRAPAFTPDEFLNRLLTNDTPIVETNLTDEEKEIIRAGRIEYKTGGYIPLDEL